jgi:hypothetical protein
LRFFVLCGAFFCLGSSAQADGTSVQRERAAELFDRGALAFREGRFGEAARAFLEADRALENSVALANALGAGLRSEQPLLVAQIAQRAVARMDLPDAVRQQAAEALARASRELARLELVCEETPCTPELDGVAVSEPQLYVLPGSHELRLLGQAAPVERIACAQGAYCRVSVPRRALPEPESGAPAPVASAPLAQEEVETGRSRALERLPLGVFITTGAAALGLGALATWSGVRALEERDKHESDPERYRPERVTEWAKRTDRLLVGAGLCAAAAAATAIWWVDWSPDVQPELALMPEGALLGAQGRF